MERALSYVYDDYDQNNEFEYLSLTKEKINKHKKHKVEEMKSKTKKRQANQKQKNRMKQYDSDMFYTED